MFSSIRSIQPMVGLWAFSLIIATWVAFAALTWSEYRCGPSFGGITSCSRGAP